LIWWSWIGWIVVVIGLVSGGFVFDDSAAFTIGLVGEVGLFLLCHLSY
jgi:hypothetical protein